MNTNSQANEIVDRLRRVETKLVRFAEELGVNTDVDPGWLTVNDDERLIYLATLSRSVFVMSREAVKRGATHLKEAYGLVYRGQQVGTITLLKVVEVDHGKTH